MARTMRTNVEAKLVMLENAEKGLRYEFYTHAVQKSNVDSTIAYYEPMVRWCCRLATGSTQSTRRISVEEGNEL